MSRKVAPDKSAPSPDVKGSPISEVAQEAMSKAEQKAEQARDKHADQDAQLRAQAAAGPSKLSSGMRVAPAKKRPNQRAATIAIPTGDGSVALVQSLDGVLDPSTNAAQISRVEAATAAFTMVQEMEERKASRRKAEKKDVMWYVRCQVCGGPGLWLFNKSGWMKPEDWATSYKPVGMMWPSREVPCQCCKDVHGRDTMLKILHVSDRNSGRLRTMKPYPRMVVEIAISEYNRLMGRSKEESESTPADAVGV